MSSTTHHPEIGEKPAVQWRVVVLLANNMVAITDNALYASKDEALAAAKRMHHAKPFLNYTAVQA